MDVGRTEKKGGLTVEKDIEIQGDIIKVILKEKYIEFIKSDKVVNRFRYQEIDNKLIGSIATVLVDANCFEKKKDARVWIQDNDLFNNLSALKTLLDIKIEKSKLPTEEFKLEDSIMVFNDDYVEMAKKFWGIQPYYYDNSNIWWLWNFKYKFWEMIDEFDLLNRLRENSSPFLNLTRSDCFSQILKGMKLIGREKKPDAAPKKWIQFKDKAFSLKSKATYSVTHDFFFTNPIPWDFAETEETPTMDKLFKEWVGEKYVPTLYEMIAYCCYSDYPIQVLFCLYGGGRNGKSCFLKILSKFIGIKNLCSTDLDLLVGKNKSRFEIFKLYKKLACLLGETNFGVLESSAILKKLTGGDLIGFEVKGKLPFDEYNYAKILIASNSLPSSEDTSEGFYRRWVIIDFPNQFKEGKDITETVPDIEYQALAKKVCGILPKLLAKGEFTNQGSIKQRKEKYILASNPLPMFLEHACIHDPDGYIRYTELFTIYTKFLSENNRRTVSKKEFSIRLTSEGFENRRTSKEGQIDQYVEGIRWKDKVTDFGKFRGFRGFQQIVTPSTCVKMSIQNSDNPENPEKSKPITKTEPIFETIHQKCNICGTEPSHTYDNKGKPICEDCYKAKDAQKHP